MRRVNTYLPVYFGKPSKVEHLVKNSEEFTCCGRSVMDGGRAFVKPLITESDRAEAGYPPVCNTCWNVMNHIK